MQPVRVWFPTCHHGACDVMGKVLDFPVPIALGVAICILSGEKRFRQHPLRNAVQSLVKDCMKGMQLPA